MSRRGLAVAGLAAGAAAAGVLLWCGGAVRFSAGLDAATDAASWAPDDYGPAYGHLCQPAAMPGRLRHDHPLFTRPSRLGGRRADVSRSGWAWFAAAPSEETL